MSVNKITPSVIYKAEPANKKADNRLAPTIKSPDKDNLNGLYALCSQNMGFVNRAPIKILPQNQLDKIKDELFYFEEMPADKDISIAISILGIDPNSKQLGFELQGFGPIVRKIEEYSEKQKDRIMSSSFFATITNLTDDKGFRCACLNIPFEELDFADKLSENEVTKAFLSDYLLSNSTTVIGPDSLYPNLKEAIKPVIEFLEKDENLIFSNLLSKRGADDILELIKIIERQSKDYSQNELYALLKELLEAKTTDGEFIFGSSKVSDRTSKNMLSGIEKILGAKKTAPDEFKELMELLSLTKQGKIPSYVLGTLAKQGKINPEFLNNEGNTICSNLDNETFNQLFGGVDSIAFSQGQLGDCYFVSAVFDFMKSKEGREIIYSMFSSDGKDIIVTIPDAKDYPIRYKNMALEKDGKKNINASVGIQLLEDAYTKTRCKKYGSAEKLNSIEGGNQSDVYNAFFGRKTAQCYMLADNGDSIIPTEDEIKKEIEEIKERLTEIKAQIKKPSSSETSFFGEIEWEAYRRLVAVADGYEAMIRGLIESKETLDNYHSISNEDEMLKKLISLSNNPKNIISIGTKSGDFFDKDRLIHGNHAYSILKIDTKNQTIDVANPWNTAQYSTISFEEFKQYFSSISSITLN